MSRPAYQWPPPSDPLLPSAWCLTIAHARPTNGQMRTDNQSLGKRSKIPVSTTLGNAERVATCRGLPFIVSYKGHDNRPPTLVTCQSTAPKPCAHGTESVLWASQVPVTHSRGCCGYNRLRGETGQQAGSDETQDGAHKHRLKTRKRWKEERPGTKKRERERL